MTMKNFRLIDSFYLVLLLGLVLFIARDMKKPDCLEAQTCISVVTRTQTSGPVCGNASATADCPAGTFVTGGGCNCAVNDAQMTDSAPSGNGWNCQCEDTESDSDRQSCATAICIGN